MLFALLGILLGALLTLAGLLMIAPQIRIHQIEVYSAGSWVFRGGMMLTAVGILFSMWSDAQRELVQVGWIIGIAGLMSGIITWGHEWKQAQDSGQTPWPWWRSLALQMIILGGGVLVLGLVA